MVHHPLTDKGIVPVQADWEKARAPRCAGRAQGELTRGRRIPPRCGAARLRATAQPIGVDRIATAPLTSVRPAATMLHRVPTEACAAAAIPREPRAPPDP